MAESLSAVKYVVFFAVLIIGVPLGYSLSLKNHRVEKVIFFLTLFFTTKMEDINFVSRETFRLTTKGFEIGMVDICTMILFLLVMSRAHNNKPKLPPGSYIYFTFFAFSALSIVNSAVPLFSFFELWKMVRMYMYFWVIYNYINDFEKLDDIMTGIGIIIIYIFQEVFRQKYIGGKFQSAGPFPHQNSLVMYMIILGSLVFAYVLNKKDVPLYKFLIWLGIFGLAAICIVSTLSRAGMVLFALSSVVVLSLSFGAGVTQKKIVVTIVLIILAMVILAKAWDSISERFKTAPEESANTRVNLAIAAMKMVKDEPLGIGLNNFGIKINPPWTYSSHIEMYNPDDEDEKNGLVETVYLMTAAECGWHTLAMYFILLFYFYFLNLRNYFIYRKSEYQFVTVALLGGLLAIYLESGLEWVLKQTNNFYQLMLIFALIAVMYKLEKRYHAKGLKLPDKRVYCDPKTRNVMV